MPENPLSLAAPGAGLPPVELAVVRTGFALARAFMSRRRGEQLFADETERILQIVESLTPEQAQVRVLIRRIAGIEDSSRYWSALMTLEHLVIVNHAIRGIIEQLAAEKPVPGTVSTANVKPGTSQGPEITKHYRATAKLYLRDAKRWPSLKSRTRHVHPWFGPLNAHGWHCLAAIHQTIHRRQLEGIRRGLGSKRVAGRGAEVLLVSDAHLP